MVVGTQSSPLVVSVSGRGNDIFLYWVSDCHGTQNKTDLEFDFLKGTSVHDQSRADFCKLRFKEKLYTRMYALSSRISLPGTVVYDSDSRKGTEYSNPINYTALGLEFLYRHPEYQEDYQLYLENENPDYENRILQQDFSDLTSRYDDVQLEKLLSNERALERKYSDPNEYSISEYQNEGRLYPQYYMQQPNTGNERYYPLDYRQVPERYAVVKKPRPRKINSAWPVQFLPMSQDLASRSAYSNRGKHVRIKRSFPKHMFKESLNERKASRRNRRHVGPHDGGGIQRVISTGTLAPSSAKDGSGVDLIYATFWFYPSETQGLLPEDKECIQSRMKMEKERFDRSNAYFEMDHDAYEEMVTEECLKKSGHLKNQRNSKKGYNPFNREMGQMTVYRTHLNCVCHSKKTSKQKCAQILPFDEQMWTSYMGNYGNSVAKQRYTL
ncbi:uncharacterized protein TNCT_122631 [Trichonephila clavata]|uniref:Uncharacterized protein n=1 Tax=Trichonephila clavata TaxID=2740835 RepID=A0A8X6KAY3_TRICU|nr:uncharacterized protein TNCT_122631 [Trichonephila clavata]